MKIVKRDGRIVEYDSDKIRLAISKANKEVEEVDMATDKEIEEIISYIENLKRKRMLVEDIQDIIEEKLMKFGRYVLAKEYIIYRYTRALVRKSNTTDESILAIIKNPNAMLESTKNSRLAYAQRDLIAGEISKDLTKRMLLPEKIVKAHENGAIYFHDMEYFLQPMFNASLINLKDMLENGTVINGKAIDSPKGFQAACNVTVQILTAVSSGQYGEVSIDVNCLGKYLKKTYTKTKDKMVENYEGKIFEEQIEELVQDRVNEELITGVQTLIYQTNTLITANGKSSNVIFYLNITDTDEYISENARIIEELLRQTGLGIKNKKGEYETYKYPKLIYVVNEINYPEKAEYNYLTRLAMDTTCLRQNPSYMFSKTMKQMYKNHIFSPIGSRHFLPLLKTKEGEYVHNGRFNQGSVSLNLPQIAMLSKEDKNMFWEILEERLELCFEALMHRHYALLGTISDASEIHWQHGAIARIASGEKIDRFLKDKYSSLALGYIGMFEAVSVMTKENEEEKKEFALEIVKKLKETCKKWELETDIAFEVWDVDQIDASKHFIKLDKETFGNIKDITDKASYTNSYHLPYEDKISEIQRLKEESEFLNNAKINGVITLKADSIEELKEIINYAYDNTLYIDFKRKKIE